MRADLANRTHCRAGHPYNEANTYWYRGWRECRVCRRETYARHAEAAGRTLRRRLTLLERLPKKSPIYEQIAEWGRADMSRTLSAAADAMGEGGGE